MIHLQDRFEGYGGTALFVQGWLPDGEARAHLAIVHGIAEHSGRYSNVVTHGTRGGFAVWGFDLRGHGRSEGRPGHIRSWAEYRNDLSAFLAYISDPRPEAPCFVLGHSLGALIVLDYVQTSSDGPTGAIISAAPIEPTGVARPHLVALARLLSTVWPTFTLNLGLAGKALSRDPEVAAAYESDPLVHKVATARWGSECLAAVKRVKSQPQAIRLPSLFIHGGKDPLNLARGVSAFFEQLTIEDKLLRLYPDSLHEPHNDLDAAVVVGDIFAWVTSHLG
ncbi:MAG: alpha/beta hydrolase [Anaerolineales bacterium]|nr:alpha/beta hydrolase [Anaerolineales bacterium]